MGGTYAGNPLACEAALKVIEIIENEDLNGKAEQLGHQLETYLTALSQDYEQVKAIRRLGAMVAFEVVDPETGEPDKALTAKIIKTANEKGLLLLSAGIKGNVIRFLLPLVITDQELNKGLNILTEVFEKAIEKQTN